jgi:ubiquinone/menaquinone biosynthesis C-methylase UbiE
VTETSTLDDLQGPAGNSFDKYGSGNPVVRRLMERFLGELDGLVTLSGASSLLDVGCGEGIVTERMAALLPEAKVVGLDVADPALLPHWERRRTGQLEFVAGSAYDLEYEDGAFDVCSAIEVFEHLERPERALAEMARVARRAVILSVPWEPVWRAGNMATGRYLKEYGNTPGHINHWTRKAFTSFAGRAGTVVSVRSPFPWTIVVIGVKH